MRSAIDLVDDFEWTRCRYGYRLSGAHKSRAHKKSGRKWFTAGSGSGIEIRKSGIERYRLKNFPVLFETFAKAKPTPAGILKFCQAFGLLRERQEEGTTRLVVSIDEQLEDHAALRHAVALWKNGKSSDLIRFCNARARNAHTQPRMRVELQLAGTDEYQFRLVPTNLIDAMWAQFMLHACSKALLFQCAHCHKPFQVGTGTGRRQTAKYCSNACKVAAFKARKEAENSGRRPPHVAKQNRKKSS
jgi:hypothetical protein